MKLETKLGLSTGVLILTSLLSALSAHVRIQEATRLSLDVTTQRIPVVMTTRDLRLQTVYTTTALESYMLFGIDPNQSASFRKSRQQSVTAARSAMATLNQMATQYHLNTDTDKLNDQLNAMLSLQDKAEQLNESKTPEGTAQAYDILQNQILPLENSLVTITSELGQSQMALTNQDMARLRDANRSALNTLWSATILGALVGGIISFLLGKRITSAVALVVQRANSIASGDLTGAPLQLNTNDQIGTLAQAMQQMQTNLATIIGTVVDTAGNLTISAASMRTAGDQIHRRIDQQSQQTQQAATAMQEMSLSIAEVSRHTQSAAESARNAAETARVGGSIVKDVLGNMHSIASAVSETSATVTLLGEDSHRISQIVTVIDEIARKTNLLALNAAIEAARAGEQGRGFAVVAGEVRRLAESTAQATGEIAAMIQGIQDRTRIAIASMESGTTTVQLGVNTTHQAGEALQRIIGMAEQVDRMITQIAIATSQQAVAANQSSSSLDAIHTLSHDNLTEMATTASGIESLRTTAVALEQQVDHFHIESLSTAPKRKAPLTGRAFDTTTKLIRQAA
jgi:methyl-accepting chemotaxis protein